MSPLRVVRIHAWELRRLFNEHGYLAQIQSGVWEVHMTYNRHPSPEVSKQPACTRSQVISYYADTGEEMVRIHRYLRRDGSLGASGLPDPKLVFHEGTLYLLDDYEPWN